jgi:murein DD-endopeptidase MepM/ murein hydrolase activator NlpD
MAHALTATNGLFRSRDLFMHDGAKLRRIRLSVPVQSAFFVLLLLLVSWSVYAAALLMRGEQVPAPVKASASGLERLVAATELRAREIERRQEVLAAMMAGDDIDVADLPATTRLAALPVELAGPLARAEGRQAADESAAAAKLEGRYKTASRELRKLGLTPQRLAVGGPFEPAAKGDSSFKALFNSWKKLDQLQDGVISVPAEKPVRIAAFTSGFGVRSDPFGAGAARHRGIDLAGPIGTPIYATADGVVTAAAWNNGGYGNLVKIEHGRGIETRYGHLSAFLVQPGQRVKRGDLIARMGSTGRSTGSHLHYEVRIDGRAVNPIPFMRSTEYLLAMRSAGGVSSMDRVAIGGPEKGRK